jgi:hypothetical protein
MSDWQVGDLAVCVNDEPCPCCGQRQLVRRGNVYTVAGVIDDPGDDKFEAQSYLVLADVPHTPGTEHGYLNEVDEQYFRKIRPDEREACEPEFVTLLQRIKRKEVA